MQQEIAGEKQYQKSFNRLSAVIVAVFAILLARLWYLQEIQGPQLQKSSEANRIGEYRIGGPRGMIFDREGEALVDNRPSFDVIYNPTLVPKKKRRAFLYRVCEEIGCDVTLAEERLRRRPGAITLKEDISRSELARVETLAMLYEGNQFPLRIEQTGKRTFTFGSLFAHVIGHTGEINQQQLDLPEYAGYRPGDRVGRTGVEATYEKHLRPGFGLNKVEENARGVSIRQLEFVPAEPGKNLVLNLSRRLQHTAARALAGHAGAIVALDPRNGKVLALYSAPSFDPELFTRPLSKEEWASLKDKPHHPLQNKAIGGLYPPGSTFKVVSALAGLQEGEITPKKGFECLGKWRFGERDFRCHNERGHGFVNLYNSIMRSCDVYYYKLSVELGIDRISKYARILGGGSKTGIDIPGELDGLIPDREWKERVYHKNWMPGETLNTAIGQGSVTMTPLQLAVMYAAIANRGTLYQPQVVDKVLAPNGKVIKQFEPVVVSEAAFDEENFDHLHKALSMVVNAQGGSAYHIRLKSMLVAGKTGTSQVRQLGRNRATSRYVDYKYRDHALFASFAPVEEPEIVVIVVVEHGGFGSRTAAPIARMVLQTYAAMRATQAVERATQ
ncbi:MAG: penicillin-binding protein 2 [Candidatus Lernaella stagnicola]|nr:penicillin-binding protein 2 [Candidatus Lernaella stagnicola]